jgi:rubrerythrin
VEVEMEKQHSMKGPSTGPKKETGASDLEFDLLSEMHSLLKGNQALERYIEDAKSAGDQEVERCFKELHDQNKQHVTKLRGLLASRIAKAA